MNVLVILLLTKGSIFTCISRVNFRRRKIISYMFSPPCETPGMWIYLVMLRDFFLLEEEDDININVAVKFMFPVQIYGSFCKYLVLT